MQRWGAMSRSPVRRKCRFCNRYFEPDPRTVDRQRYCFEVACRQASKTASQTRWLKKDGNGDTFRGPHHVRRVQAWRRAHPGYWKRPKTSSQSTQPAEDQSAKSAQSSCNATSGLPVALQDDCLAQDPAFIGLISMVTGSTLLDDIAATTRQVVLRGRNILGLVPSPRSPACHDPQVSPSSRASASDPPELQLG